MSGNRILGLDELDAVLTAALTAQVVASERRPMLLAGIDNALIATMPETNRALDQVWSDLNILNEKTQVPAEGEPPLARWMQNAVQLTTGRLESEVFADWRLAILARQNRSTKAYRESTDLRRLRARKGVDLAVARWYQLRRDEAPPEAVEAARLAMLAAKREARAGGRLHEGYPLGNRYVLVKLLGSGGFAEVWKAWDREGGSGSSAFVAVKVLHGQFTRSEERRDRFFRGAEQMSRLTHPGVVRVFVARAEDDGFFYFVMELVEGGNLRAAVLSDSISVAEGIVAVLDIADALKGPHEAGLVHRDVKPANILLTSHRRAKLTDFDLVKAHDTTGGTRTGGLGTAVFAAPEALVDATKADARSDVYGLGMTLAFVAHGSSLPGWTIRTPETLVSSLPILAGVRNVILRSISFAPSDRYANAGGFASALLSGLGLANELVPEKCSAPGAEGDSPRGAGESDLAGSPRPSRLRWAGFLFLFTLLGWLAYSAFRPSQEPVRPLERYIMINIKSVDVAGRAVGGAKIFINGRKFGLTDYQGEFRGRYDAKEGEVLSFNVEAPRGYELPPNTDQSQWQITARYPKSGKLEVDFSTTLQIPERDHLFMIRTPEADTSVRINGKLVGRSDRTGHALLRVAGVPGTKFSIIAGDLVLNDQVFAKHDEIYILTERTSHHDQSAGRLPARLGRPLP